MEYFLYIKRIKSNRIQKIDIAIFDKLKNNIKITCIKFAK